MQVYNYMQDFLEEIFWVGDSSRSTPIHMRKN